MVSGKPSGTYSQIDDNQPMHLKSILKQLLRERGMTIAGLSRATGIPLQTLHGWLQGTEPKSIRQLKKVADHFGISVDRLCFRNEVSNRSMIGENTSPITEYVGEINAGIFEVVLRRVDTKRV